LEFRFKLIIFGILNNYKNRIMENSEVTMEGIKEGEVKELSKAELKARREEITNYYQDHIPHSL